MKMYVLMSVIFGLTFFTLGLLLNRNFGDFRSLLGYRSGLAMKNVDTWMEANHYAGRLLMILASLKLLVIIFLPWNNYNSHLFLLYILAGGITLSFLFVYIFTERHLRDLFFRDGKRRPKF